jgi:hypothetical protein
MKTKENLLSLGNVIFLLDSGGNNRLEAHRIKTKSNGEKNERGDTQ